MTTTPRWEIKVVSSITDFDQYKIGEVGKDNFAVVDRLSDAEELIDRVNAIIDERNVLMQEVAVLREYYMARMYDSHADIHARRTAIDAARLATDALIRSKP